MTTTIKVKGSALPADVITVRMLLSFEMNRASGNTVVVVPGRTKPVVTTRPAKARAGTIGVLLENETAAIAFDALLSRRAIFTLTDTDRVSYGMDFALAAGDGALSVQLNEDTRYRFVGKLQVVEQ